MLEETLSILAQEQVKGLDEAKVFLPDDLERMERMIGKRAHERAVCRYDCVNMDAFALARRLRQAYPQEKILVLNLANPFEPEQLAAAVAGEQSACCRKERWSRCSPVPRRWHSMAWAI